MIFFTGWEPRKGILGDGSWRLLPPGPFKNRIFCIWEKIHIFLINISGTQYKKKAKTKITLEKATGWILFMSILRTNSNKNEGVEKIILEKEKNGKDKQTN